MSPSGLPEFDLNDLARLNSDSCYNDFFDELSWNAADPSQPYTGAVVQGELNNYPDFLASPSTAPISLHPTHGDSLNEGYTSPFYQGSAMPSFPILSPFLAHSPVPTLSRGVLSLSPKTHLTPITPTRGPTVQSQVIPDLDGLGFDLPTATGSSPQSDIQSCEELWGKYPQSDPSDSDPITGVVSHEPDPAPVASSSGPQRTRRCAREGRRYDPMKPSKNKAESEKDGWNQTLVRFQDKMAILYGTHQPSGSLVPATALDRVNKLVKGDLERSPLQDLEAGKGKRSRDVEGYLRGLLRVIIPAEPTPTPPGVESDEDETAAALFSRVADELGSRLVVINQRPALRGSVGKSKIGQKMGGKRMGRRTKKNETEKGRRDSERYHLGRISRLFKRAEQQWSRMEVLGLAVLSLLYGPEAFPGDFVKVRPTAPGP